MTLQEIIDLAVYSELSNVSVKANNSAIVAFINMGMVELYKRFTIKTEEAIIETVEGQSIYDLPTNFMYCVSAYREADIGYNLDNDDLPINDEDDPFSIFFPSHRQVQVPSVINTDFISLIYITKPTKYTVDDLDVELDLPEVLIDCLLHYLGYRAHLGVRSDSQSENNSHYARFERSVQKAKELGVSTSADSYGMVDRLSTRGFV